MTSPLSSRPSALLLVLLVALSNAACKKTPRPVEAVDSGPVDAGEMVEVDAGPMGPPGIGSACTTDDECGSGHCDRQPTGGYCLDTCTDNSSCPEGSVCQQLGRGTAYCLAECNTAADCRTAYTCQEIASTCVPSAGCAMDSDCPEGTTCNTYSGLCTGAIGPVSHVGATCQRDSQCTVGPYPFCIQPDMHFTDGYCSSVCSNDMQCGARGICVAGLVTGENYQICMQGCATNTDCRANYNCVDRNDQKFCLAFCTENADCVDPGTQCEVSTGLCHAVTDGGEADAGTADAGPVDAGEPDDAGPPIVTNYDGGYPAPFPAPPQVAWAGGPVLSHPTFIPIFFKNDVPEQVAQIEDFDQKVGTSAWWTAVTADYGVGAVTVAPSVHVDEISTGTITDDYIQQWLKDHIASGVLPGPDANTLYLLHYPWSMSIVLQGSRSCRSFGGYHSNFKLSNGRQVAYAVMPRCGAPTDENLIGTETMSESHEIIEAATDPQPFGSPAYGTVDQGHYEWAQFLGGGEVGDMCESDPNSYIVASDINHAVQRSWSNSAMAAGHDPCVPAPTDQPYFAAAPELSETMSLFIGGGFVDVQSAHVTVGETKTVILDLYSDGDTGGPWTVEVRDYGSLTGGNGPFSYRLDRTSGQNGDKLQLFIKSIATSPRTGAFGIRSTLNGKSHTWIGLADQ